MAEPVQPQQAKPVVRKIKIKLGAQVISTTALSGPKPDASSQDNRSQGSRQLLQQCTGKDRAILLQQARNTQAQLQGYVPPTASPSAVVACLRQGEPFSLSAALPPWDFSLDALRVRSDCSEGDEGRQAKRQRTEHCGAPKATIPVPKGPARELGPVVLGRPSEVLGQGHKQPALSAGAPSTKRKQQPQPTVGESLGCGPSTESNSDQATNSQVYIPTSPDNCIQQGHSGQQRSASAAQPRPGAPSPKASTGVTLPSRTECPGPGPGHRRPVQTCSQGVQVGASDFPLVPLHFLDHGSSSSSAMGSAYATLGAFDFHMPPDTVPGTSEASIEKCVAERLLQARQVKRDGDANRGGQDRPWKVRSLSKYVESALMFMEVCDWMLLAPRVYNHTRIAELYAQTSELLAATAKFADGIRGSGMGKEALRILAERLCAVCSLRSASYMSAKLIDQSKKASEALRDYQHRKDQAKASAAPGRAAGDKPSQLSPEVSTHSSADQQQVGGLAPPQQLLDMQGKLVAEAKKISKFSEYVRKSTNGFQAFLERPDVRQDQHAKLVSMHLAAICLDMGMTPGSKIINHAKDALSSISFGDLPR